MEIDDLTKFWPKEPQIQNDLTGFIHYKCHKTVIKKDGEEIAKQSNLNFGLRPIFRNVNFEDKTEKDLL